MHKGGLKPDSFHFILHKGILHQNEDALSCHLLSRVIYEITFRYFSITLLLKARHQFTNHGSPKYTSTYMVTCAPSKHETLTHCWINVGQCQRQWANVESNLGLRLVFAAWHLAAWDVDSWLQTGVSLTTHTRCCTYVRLTPRAQ